MQLSKLKKRTFRIEKYYQKFRYKSLGIIIPPALTFNTQQLTQKMIDDDACLHVENSEQLLLVPFKDEVPNDSHHKDDKTNRLYLYFLGKIKTGQQNKQQQSKEQKKSKTKQKQKKQIQLWTENMIKIYEEADKRHQIRKFKISKLEKQIQKLYKECHQYYESLMHMRNNIVETVLQQNEEEIHIEIPSYPNTRKNSLLSNSDEQNMYSKKIGDLKDMIADKEDELNKIKEAEKLLKQEKGRFLKLLLKNGYRQIDGIKWILIKLAKNNENLTKQDMYHIIDDTAKNYILVQYDNIKKQIQKQNNSNLPSIRHTYNPKSHSWDENKGHSLPHMNYTRLIDISKCSSSQKIYKETQQYIVNWVRKEQWKVRSLSIKKRNTLQDEVSKDWKSEQIKRLKNTYPKQECEKMLKYLFGSSKYYSHKQPITAYEHYLRSTSKQSVSSQGIPRSSQRDLQSLRDSKITTKYTNADKQNEQMNIIGEEKRKKSQKYLVRQSSKYELI